MAAGGRHMTAKDLTALELLAVGHKIADAAAKSGLSERTLYRRLQEPSFRKQLDDLRAQAIERTASALSAAGLTAVATLVRLLTARAEHVQCNAARSLLELGFKARETCELEKRIAALEAARSQKEDVKRWQA